MSKFRARPLASVCLVALMLGTPSVRAEVSETVREALEKGNAAVQQRQWTQANQHFKIATESDSSAPEVMIAVARFSDAKGGRDLPAIAWYRAYLAAQPHASARDQILARIDLLEKRLANSARAAIERALSTSSSLSSNDRPGWLANIAVAQAKSQDFQGALSTASSLRAIMNPYSEDPYGQVANALAQIGDLGAADEVMRRVEQSKRSAAYRQLTYTVAYAKKIKEALNYASQTSGSDRISAYSSVAKAQSETGDQSGARSSLTTAIDSMRYMEANTRKPTYFSLVETAADIGEFETARRLYAEGAKLYNPNDRWESYSLNSARWQLAKGYAKWGRVDEATAMLPQIFPNNKDPSVAWYKPSLERDIAAARTRETEKQRAVVVAQIKEGKLLEADAALSKAPATLSFAASRIAMARAYVERRDLAAARKHIEPAAVALSKASVAAYDSAYSFTLARLQLFDLYVDIGDLAAAKRILDATAGTIVKLADAEQKQSPIEYLTRGYSRLAGVTAATKNFAGAKAFALEGIKLAAQAKPSSRAQALANLSSLSPQIGIGADLAATLPSLPDGYYKKNVASAAIRHFAELGQEANALAAASHIGDINDRKSELSSVLSRYISAKSWAKALVLANEPATAGRLLPEVAVGLVNDDKTADAIALEPRFTMSSSEAGSYFSRLASHHANRGDIDAAVTTSTRIVSVPSRITSLLSVAQTVNSLGGRPAAQAIVDRAMALAAEMKTPLERAEICNSIRYYLNSLPNDNKPDSGRPPEGSCVAEALAITDPKSRLSPFGNALSSYYPTTQPIISSAIAPLRPAVSRLMTEAHTSDSRDSYISYALGALAREGAVEKAIDLGFQILENPLSYAPLSAAATWLTSAGDTQAVLRLVDRVATRTATLAEASLKDSALSSASSLATQAGDFERAIKLASEITSPGNRVGAFVSIANSANSRQKFDVALNALDRAIAADKQSESHHYNSSFASIAIQAGHKNAESFVETYFQDKSITPSTRVSLRNTLINRLLELKQYQRAATLIPAQEADLTQLPANERAPSHYYSISCATALGALGDTARLNTVFANAPLPEEKIAVLLAAMSGFLKAENKDAARLAVESADKLAPTISSAQTRASNTLSIVNAYNQIGNAEAARKALNRAIELNPSITDVATRASQLKSISNYLARAGDLNGARRTLAQSLEVIKISRSDAAGWIEHNVATSIESVNGEEAERIALAISDPRWRASTLLSFASARRSRNVPDPLAILRQMQPHPVADTFFESLVSTAVGKLDFDAAREHLARISHAGRRDKLRRFVVLAQARAGGVAVALADMVAITDKPLRAYTFIDLGAFLQTVKSEASQQNAYFAQLCNFEAIKLADAIPDPLLKSDLLAAAAAAQNQMEQGSGTAAQAKAVAAAGQIGDERAKRYALQWAQGLKVAQKPDPINREESNAYISKARYSLTNDMYMDLEAHIDSFATSNPGDRISKLTNIATSFTEEVRSLKKIATDFSQKRKALGK
ncbi:tetratricopeptide repeat protein [Bradyrhizobium sp.]|uniref:tetratricopeptide repeat protein n=1 Tax=Bradyrhizobium sp. TaxID=376 RepID=UPI0040376480